MAHKIRSLPYDVSAPTDARPYFFNQLSFVEVPSIVASIFGGAKDPVIAGNLKAAKTLYLLLIASILMVVLIVLLPAWSSKRQVARGLVIGGTAYFVLIGAGFMFVEMSFLQLWSVYLGHPIYSLSVVLFSVIVWAGIGSFFSEAFMTRGSMIFVITFGALSLYLFSVPYWISDILTTYSGVSLFWRALICTLVIAPAGNIMGLALPTGMSLVQLGDVRPTPWFWGINGAAGVAAATLSIAMGLSFDIYMPLRIGAACYMLLPVFAIYIVFSVNQATSTP